MKRGAFMLVHSSKQYRERVEFVAFAPTGELYASSHDGLFRWPDPTAQTRERVSTTCSFARPGFSQCGRYFATSQDKLSVFDRECNTRVVPRLPANVWNTAPAFADGVLLMLQLTGYGKPRVAARALNPDNWNDDLWAAEVDRAIPAPFGVVGDRLLYVLRGYLKTYGSGGSRRSMRWIMAA